MCKRERKRVAGHRFYVRKTQPPPTPHKQKIYVHIFDLAGALQGVVGEEGVGDGGAADEEAVVAQDHHVLVAFLCLVVVGDEMRWDGVGSVGAMRLNNQGGLGPCIAICHQDKAPHEMEEKNGMRT